MAGRGHQVYALNRLETSRCEYGVSWRPMREVLALPELDIAVAVNSVRLFDGLSVLGKITWFHNPPSTRNQIKRRNLIALLRHRPHAVLLGEYQAGLLNRWLPYRSRSILFHGVGCEFFASHNNEILRPPRAVFTSQPTRGLSLVVSAWQSVREVMPEAELHVFCPQAYQAQAVTAAAGKSGIIVRGSVSRLDLARELRQARVALIPGVSDETFCLAAAEATASGVPIVTLGAGALAERVRQGKNGFVARDEEDFKAQVSVLMTDSLLWKAMHAECLRDPSLANWDRQAANWERLFKTILQSSA